MKKKEVLRALREMDASDAAQLGERYLIFTSHEDARMQQKIAEQLREHSCPEIPDDVPLSTGKANRFAWVSHVVTVAACVTVFGGTFAGLYWMAKHAPVIHEESSAVEMPAPVIAHAVGESYLLPDVEGSLSVTVTNASYTASGLYEVTFVLQSGNTPVQFYADNLMTAVGQANGKWVNCSPRMIGGNEKAQETPYAIKMAANTEKTIKLFYVLDGQIPLAIVTSYRTDVPYTKLMEDEHET